MTVEHEAYTVHIAYCDHCQHQRWCQEREDLLWEADVADQVRRFEPATVG
jgi:hypothetical protein